MNEATKALRTRRARSFACRKVEGSQSGAACYEYRVPFAANDDFLEYLGLAGFLKCYRDLPRPYYVAILIGGAQVKGLIGDSLMKVVFPSAEDLEGKKTTVGELLRRWLLRSANALGESSLVDPR
jgi:hypothetical protein